MSATRPFAFFEMPAFTKWVRKNRLNAAVKTLKAEIEANPDAGDVIPNGGGLRKIRMAGQGRGKRGGFRVIYLLVLDRTTAVLMAGYSKSGQADLSADELASLVALATGLEFKVAEHQTPEEEGDE